jgi:hypothetical protein
MALKQKILLKRPKKKKVTFLILGPTNLMRPRPYIVLLTILVSVFDSPNIKG